MDIDTKIDLFVECLNANLTALSYAERIGNDVRIFCYLNSPLIVPQVTLDVFILIHSLTKILFVNCFYFYDFEEHSYLIYDIK